MIKDVVVHHGLLGNATGTFVCMVAYSEKARSEEIDLLKPDSVGQVSDIPFTDHKRPCPVWQ